MLFPLNSEKYSLTTHDMKMTCILDPANDVIYIIIYIWIYREILFDTLNYVRSYAKTCCFSPLHTDKPHRALESGDQPLIFLMGIRWPKLSGMKPLTHIEGSTISHRIHGAAIYANMTGVY